MARKSEQKRADAQRQINRGARAARAKGRAGKALGKSAAGKKFKKVLNKLGRKAKG